MVTSTNENVFFSPRTSWGRNPGHAAQWCLWDPGSSYISALTSLPCWFSSSCLSSLGPKMTSVTAAVYTHSGRRCKGQKPFSLWVVVSWFTLTPLETLHGTFRSINGQGNWDYCDWFRPIIIIIFWHWGRSLTLKSKNLSILPEQLRALSAGMRG